jgi:RNA binding exosome subunit
MKQVHNVTIKVFEKEKINEVKLGLEKLAALNLEEEKLKIYEKKAEGFEDTIYILELKLEKAKHVSSFLKKLTSQLKDEQKELLKRQAESRLDEELNFFIRIDKDKWLNKELIITDSGDCFHIKMLIACFPKKKEKAIAIINEIFK